MRLRWITWGLCVLNGDFMSYTKLLSWLLCFIASFHIHPPNKQKRNCSRGTTSTRWTSVGINLPIIPCFEKIQLQILWSFVTKWMHTKDKFYPGSWRCNLIYYWKKINKTKEKIKKLLVRERPLRFSVKAALLPLCANIMPEELRPGYFIPEWSLGKMCSHKDPINPFPQKTSCYRDRTPLGRWALQAFLQASREPKPTADPPCDIIHV